MARLAIQLVSGFIGTQFGLPFGVGAFVGTLIGNFLFPQKLPDVIGPRLQDLNVTTSTYGNPIPFGYGAMLYNGNVIWSPGLVEHRKEETFGGGKGLLGGPSQTVISFSYTVSFAVSYLQGPITAYSRIWADTKLLRDPFLIQDASGTITGDLDVLGKFEDNLTFFLGTATQLPDITIEAEEGVGNISAHRDLAYIVYTDLPLEDFANRMPTTRAEVFTNASDVFPFKVYPLVTTFNARWSMLNFRRTRVFAWDLIAGAMHVAELKITDLSIVKSKIISAPGGTLSFAGITGGISSKFRWAFDVFDNFYWPITDSTQSNRIRRFLKVNLDSLSHEISIDHGISGQGNSHQYSCGNYIDGNGIARTRHMVSCRSGGDHILIWKKLPDLLGGIPNPNGIDLNQIFTPITVIDDSALDSQYNLGVFSDDEGFCWLFENIGNPHRYDEMSWIKVDEFGLAGQGLIGAPEDRFVLPRHNVEYFYKAVAYDVTTNSMVLFHSVSGSSRMDIVRWSLDSLKETARIDDVPGDVPGITTDYYDRRAGTLPGVWVDLDNQFLEDPDIYFHMDDEASVADGPLILRLDVSNFTIKNVGPDEGGGYRHVRWEADPNQMDDQWGAWYNQVSHAIVYLNTNSPLGGVKQPDIKQYFLDREGITPGDVVNIQVIVDDILTRSGFVSADFDTSELGREAAADPAFPEFKDVIGFAVDKQQTGKDVLTLLAQAFAFHLVESDWKIKAVWRGDVVVSPDVVPIDDLGAYNFGESPPAQVTETRKQQAELASRINITFIDQNREYQDNTAHAKRADELVTIKEPVDIRYPIVLNPSQARQMALIHLFQTIIGRRSFEVTLPPKYMKYDPADFLILPVGSGSERVMVSSTDLAASGMVKITAEFDDPEIFLPPFGDIATGGSAAPLPKKSTVVGGAGITGSTLFLMDIALLRDIDEGTGSYTGASGPDQWPGCIVVKSPDGSEYNQFTAFDASQNAVSGAATTVLADGPVTIFDEGNSVTVFLTNDTDALVSVTELQVLNESNPALLGNEIIQFKTAVDNGDGTWTLSGLLRGRRGSEAETSTHVIGDRFVLLNSATIRRTLANSSEIGLLRFFKAVTFGMSIDDVPAIGFSLVSVGQKPYSVVFPVITRNGANDIIITWIRRTRVDGEWRDLVDVSLSETTESYEVDILDATGGNFKRKLTSTSETVTYTIADQTTDFGGARDPVHIEIYQISSVVGRGFKTEFTG